MTKTTVSKEMKARLAAMDREQRKIESERRKWARKIAGKYAAAGLTDSVEFRYHDSIARNIPWRGN